MRINFLPQTLRKPQQHPRRVWLFTSLITCALCFALGSGFLMRQQSKQFQQQADTLLQADSKQDLSQLLAERDQLRQEAETQNLQAAASSNRHALPLLTQICSFLPPTVTLSQIDYFENEIQLSGISGQLQDVALFLQNMEVNSFYAECKLTKLQKRNAIVATDNSVWEFTLRLDLPKSGSAS